MNNINFDRPYVLIGLLVVLILLVVSFIISVNKENKSKQNVTSFIIHIIMSILIMLSFAGMTYETTVTETNIYVLADVSYSSSKNLDLIDDHIKKLQNSVPDNSKIGVICFGKNQEVLVELGGKLKSVKESKVDNSETDIASAIKFAVDRFGDDVVKRLVLISDGEDTSGSDLGSLVRSLSVDNIYVDAIYIDNNIKEDVKEVQINEVDYKQSTYLDNDESVYIYLQSNMENSTYVNLELHCDGSLFKHDVVKLQKGHNMVSYSLNTDEPGEHEYEVIIKPEEGDDESQLNNTYYFNQKVAEKMKVLFVGSSLDDEVQAKKYYGKDVELTTITKAKDVPYSMEELAKYDEYVLSNVDVRTFNNSATFVNNLDVLVSEFGKSLITMGNTYIQNNEDDEILTTYSDMLPTKYGNDNKKRSVTILFDISKSMLLTSKMIIAKKAACAILDNLDDDVRVSCIVFYGEIEMLFTMKDASERETLKKQINDLQCYQGTFLGSALRYTYEYVKEQKNVRNEVVLISDGLPYGGNGNGSESNLSTANVQRMAAENIAFTSVCIVDNGDGKTFMQNLATKGKGDFYYFNDEDKVVSGILDGVLNSLNETILDKSESTVSISLTKDSLVSGITELPNVKGLYNNSAKSSADVVLEATYTTADGASFIVPLYSYWKYGNGRVASFASNIGGDWAKNWKNDPQANLIMQNMVSLNQPNERIDSSFIVSNESKGTFDDIVVVAPNINKKAELRITCTDNDGNLIKDRDGKDVKDVLLSRIVEDNIQKYVTEINTSKVGEYNVKLVYSLGGNSTETYYKFHVSYLPEYNSFTIYEASTLYYMVSENGQVSEDGNLVLVNDSSDVLKYVINFAPVFMLISAILIVVDIIIRKLKLQDIKSLFKKIRKENK